MLSLLFEISFQEVPVNLVAHGRIPWEIAVVREGQHSLLQPYLPRERDRPWAVGTKSLEDKIAVPWVPLTKVAGISDTSFLPALRLNILFVI